MPTPTVVRADRIFEVLAVDSVHFREVVEVGEENTDTDGVGQPGPCRLRDGGHVVERPAHLVGKVLGDGFGNRVDRNLSRNE